MQENFLVNLECLAGQIFGRFALRPKYKRLKKKLLKMMSFVLPHMNRPEMAESSHKKFWCLLIKIVAINSYFTKKLKTMQKNDFL